MRRLPMRKIKDVLRLHAAGRSTRQIGPSVGVGRSTVAEYLRRAEVAGLSWPLPEGLDEVELERQLFPPPPPSKRVSDLLCTGQPVHAERKGQCGPWRRRSTMRFWTS